jgi:isoquinoline 1-oxidoreductase beta subunit
MTSFVVNGRKVSVAAAADTPLLWVLRDKLGLKGTKYGCGTGACGSCTVQIDGEATRACKLTLAEATGRRIVTIEGLAADLAHPVLSAWIAERVPQCGYCQPAMVLAAAALLGRNPAPSDAEVDAAMSGVLCRCGTYQRARRAVHRAAKEGNRPAAPVRTLGPATAPVVFAPDPWIRIHADGTVSVVIDHSEMGQGVMTALAMLVAEELEVDLDQVRTEFAPAATDYFNPAFGEQMTGGSTSVRESWTPLRQAGAAARDMLIAAAAAIWGVRRATCRAERGAVVHAASGRRLGYGEVGAKAAALRPPRSVRLKRPGAFRLIGKPTPGLDVPAKVCGTAVFGADVTLPDMLVAAVLRCPVPGGKPAHFDAAPARGMPGVRDVVAIDSGIAVVADSFCAAVRAREAIRVTWDEGANAGLSSDEIRRRFVRAAKRAGRVARETGDVAAALGEAATVVEVVYETPYLAHATLEPMNGTARIGPDGCDIWVPTQAQTEAQLAAARAAGLPPERVRVHTTFLGGGFGRRLEHDYVTEAVQIAKAVGKPVQVQWTRTDDMQHDFYRPANYTVLKGGLDKRGRPCAWRQHIVGPPLALEGVDIPYAVRNLRESHVEEDPGLPTGPWRSVGASQNAFVVESFIDELAHAADADPYLFRRRLLARALRHRGVLDLAAAKAGWGRPPPAGRHRGIALYFSFGSWVAQVAEVSVSDGGEIRVHRVVAAIDCGIAVNPDGIEAQMEGAVAFGLGAALKGEITFADGQAMQRGFRDYPLLTFAEMPEVEVHIVASAKPPGGVGEPGVPPIAPAVANAVFAATGKRIRRLPIRAADLAAAAPPTA